LIVALLTPRNYSLLALDKEETTPSCGLEEKLGNRSDEAMK
jgi:hypothetical protein